ncbi:MAG: molybdopterin-dependent oxidoreductase, partial [Gemmatimonadales bacterium]|jgi:DMSO/TMAO reductase YedYZ molybdopterin-dependent catalytic subunit
MARRLPGGLVTFGIDTMVALIELVAPGGTADLAKPAERMMALGGCFVGGLVFAVALLALLDRVPDAMRRRVAAAAGVVLAVVVALLSSGVNEAYDAIVLPALWIAVLAVAWTVGLEIVYRRLAAPAATPAAAAPAGPSAASVTPLDRRRFLVRVGGASAAITVVGAGLALTRRGGSAGPALDETWSATHPLPNADDPITPVAGTRPELTPLEDHYRIDINTSSPRVDEAEWRLRIDGLVENPVTLTLGELRVRYRPLHQFVTLACISNRIGGPLTSTTRWTGVPLRDVLQEAGLRDEATHVVIRSADDFHETVARELVEADERVMLTYAWDGIPLLRKHGFPLRLYIPDRYGMKQPKWITRLEAVDEWQPGYWVQRNWDREARMRATAVIDSVATDMMIAEAGADTLVPVGGIAHAGARGISHVEVRVDDGPWVEAGLRTPLADTTWVVWRYDWPFREGRHTFTVRCVDGNGVEQIPIEQPMRPSGATGLHSTDVML